ncbi:MAG: hypothetical protein CL610_04455 [Anaerolineaceae bacterium]|nr:hypothetical protein [Anaerolineaceae bacterium]
MHLTCPNCETKIPSENINIQQMAAVCPACDTVFQFDLSNRKLHHRKIKPPERLTVHETDDQMDLAFRTNRQLFKNEAFLTGAIMSGVLTFVSLILAGEWLAGDITPLIPILFGVVTLCLYYWLATIVFDRTRIIVNEEEIQISHPPLTSLFMQKDRIKLAGVRQVAFEETPASVKEGYDTPQYRVWAELVDGRRKAIVNNVVDDYALFITQSLTTWLEADPDTSRLADHQPADEDLSDTEASSQQAHRG